MRKYLISGLGVAGLILAGWLYYHHVPTVPPPPKDLTKIFDKRFLEKATPEQLAVLRGEAASAPKVAVSATAAAPVSSKAQAPATAAAPAATVRTAPAGDVLPLPAGLTVTLTNGKPGMLEGQVVNSGSAAVMYTYPAGTLYSNGKGDVVLWRDTSVEVPAKGSAKLLLPVVQTKSSNDVLTGNFAPHKGDAAALRPLVTLLAHKKNVSPSVVQTAALIIADDAPLDLVASFPRLRPAALANTGTSPFAASPSDLIAALALVQEAGIDPAGTAMISEPQLEIMTMLNPESHQAAKQFFGVTDEKEWDFWKHQLLQGDPALRHFALYGIARYYPEVALQMLPDWVRANNLYRNYRLSAAWALALVEDSRAQTELRTLREELRADAGMRQVLDRALQHRADGGDKVAAYDAR